MADARKTKQQLIEELTALRSRVVDLERSEQELEQTDRALTETEARLRQIIDLVPHMIFVRDWSGRFLLANKATAEAYGTTVENLTGTPVGAHHVGDEEVARILDDDRQVMGAGVPRFIPEEQFTDARGTARVFQTIKIPYALAEGAAPAMLGVALDVTERKRTEEERTRLDARMQQARKQESLAALASGIAHDFNQLVGQILDNAALARAARAPTPAGRELLENIERAARRAADLTNQMLVYAGEVRFQQCALFLNHLIDDMGHVLEAIVPENATLRCVHDPEAMPVMADPAQLRQVVVNLTTNAAEALGEKGGTITISTGVADLDQQDLAATYIDDELPTGRYAFLQVSDTGSGMSPAEQARMFDPFFSKKSTGGGLGLAAVLGVVRGHRGTISVDSALGRGTSIRVLLPTPPLTPFGHSDR